MSGSPDRLYSLLPAIYRQTDAEQGYKLRALLRVITEQADIVEDDISQLYKNWFIETCDDWAVPYIGDLIGYLPLNDTGKPGDAASQRDKERSRILIPRRDVANTIRYRRRKGTLALLELLANDIAGWPARAVEFYRLLGWTQHLNHLHLDRGRTVDIRHMQALDCINGPFDCLAHTVDIHRITSEWAPGRYNIPSVGVFAWRLKPYSVTKTPAYCLESAHDLESAGPHCYTFSVLGNDTPLYCSPQPEQDPTHIAEPINLPVQISRREFEDRKCSDGQTRSSCASDTWYGPGKSITIWAPNWPYKKSIQPIPREAIIPADLSKWHFKVPKDKVAVDTVLGRIMFSKHHRPEGVEVSYLYAFSDDLGGGEYDRQVKQPDIIAISKIRGEQLTKLNEFANRLNNAMNSGDSISKYLMEHLSETTKGLLTNPESEDFLPSLVSDLNMVLADEAFYDPKRFELIEELPEEAYSLINQKIKAPQLLRLNRLLLESAYPDHIARSFAIYRVGGSNGLKLIGDALRQWQTDHPCHAVIEITESGVYVEQVNIELDENQSLQLRAASGKRPVIRLQDWHTDKSDSLSIRGAKGSHFTLDGLLVTGRGVQIIGPGQETEESVPQADLCKVLIRHCTLVPGWTLGCKCPPCRPEEPSIELINTRTDLRIERSITGSLEIVSDEVKTEPIRICISDSIIDATSTDQTAISESDGMIAHAVLSFVRCTVIGKVLTRAIKLAENCIFTGPVRVVRTQTGCMRFCYLPPESRTPRRYKCQPDSAADESNEGKEQTRVRVQPLFTSMQYGAPGYCQLAMDCPEKIRRGADDLSEMGVFHDLYQPQREYNLRLRLSEYTPAGMETGIIFVN